MKSIPYKNSINYSVIYAIFIGNGKIEDSEISLGCMRLGALSVKDAVVIVNRQPDLSNLS